MRLPKLRSGLCDLRKPTVKPWLPRLENGNCNSISLGAVKDGLARSWERFSQCLADSRLSTDSGLTVTCADRVTSFFLARNRGQRALPFPPAPSPLQSTAGSLWTCALLAWKSCICGLSLLRMFTIHHA